MDDETFQLVRECFEQDDGSLPGIEIAGLSQRSIEAVYSYIRERSSITTPSPEFWNEREQRSVPLEAVPNAAGLVASGTAEPFHFCFTGLHAGGMKLPELGLFVFPDNVELDYRMGPHWTRDMIGAFFLLLQELHAIAPEGVMCVPSVEPPPYPERFLQAWDRLRRR